jgi:ankyrin repeat protein
MIVKQNNDITGRNNVEMLRLLVKRGANVNLNHPEWTKHSQGATPLHTAARQGQVINASELLELGANPNYVDASGQTALHVAAIHEITGCRQIISSTLFLSSTSV